MERFPDSTYQIIEIIGRGGTGTVYLAYHVRLQKYVILKQIRGIRDTGQIRTEVDTLKQLHHPNLPQVYDFIGDGQSVYTVMDYIEGSDLDTIISGGMSYSTDDVILWFSQLTDVLSYLHAQHPPVIHSDIKPANIIINAENNAVLIDFNIAVSYNRYAVKGMSLAYASPEQISLMQSQADGVYTGEFLDGRSDIYSLCATFSYLMSGQKPSFFYGQIPLSEETCGYPDVFCEVVEKGMRPEREDRYRNAPEMKKALDHMWRRTRSFRLRVAAVILVILAAASITVFAGSRIITEKKAEVHSYLLAECNRCIQAVNSRDPETAVNRCIDFLNENAEALESEPEIKGKVLSAVGAAYYTAELYDEAVKYYTEAVGVLSVNEEELSKVYAGLMLSYMKSGETGKADYILTRASQENLSDNTLLLLEIQLESLKGNYGKCTEKAAELAVRTSDNELLIRSDIAAARCCPERKMKREWLLRACDRNTQDITVLRELAYELGLAAGDAGASSDQSEELYQKAASCLEIVCDSDTAGTNDFLSLARVCMVTGKEQRALEVLDILEQKISENSEIPDLAENIEYIHEQIDELREMAYHRRES